MTANSDTPAVPDGPALPDAPAAVTDVPPVVPLTDEERAARRGRRRKAALRWGAAAVVCALAGTGSALAVTAAERTDLPGLATRSDGRYTFPALVLPPLPSGKAVPREERSRHAADLRRLLLPVPEEAGGSLVPAEYPVPSVTAGGTPGATASASAGTTESATSSGSPTAVPAGPGAGADLVDCNTFAADQKEQAEVRALLLQYACRAATVREWTASDGTRTQIRLLSFGSSSEAWSVFTELRDGEGPKDVATFGSKTPPDWDEVYGVTVATRASGPGDTPTARLAYLSAGDLVGVVTMTNPKGVAAAAFRQVVTLQSDLLG
ncbi:hypothetical protein ABTX81_01120 [Kitasatospora sp. NPDC097605]|uniref:hypothetical protein n=1 Tax=Kitasatospora sp. NPDC097605 TaxID=3157226 RepID=UPI003323EB32